MCQIYGKNIKKLWIPFKLLTNTLYISELVEYISSGAYLTIKIINNDEVSGIKFREI